MTNSLNSIIVWCPAKKHTSNIVKHSLYKECN